MAQTVVANATEFSPDSDEHFRECKRHFLQFLDGDEIISSRIKDFVKRQRSSRVSLNINFLRARLPDLAD
ncbi:MAG: hypothetical protein MHPSP_002161, partial [Paramarteilia canceri]